jgi:hypothetical protein
MFGFYPEDYIADQIHLFAQGKLPAATLVKKMAASTHPQITLALFVQIVEKRACPMGAELKELALREVDSQKIAPTRALQQSSFFLLPREIQNFIAHFLTRSRDLFSLAASCKRTLQLLKGTLCNRLVSHYISEGTTSKITLTYLQRCCHQHPSLELTLYSIPSLESLREVIRAISAPKSVEFHNVATILMRRIQKQLPQTTTFTVVTSQIDPLAQRMRELSIDEPKRLE